MVIKTDCNDIIISKVMNIAVLGHTLSCNAGQVNCMKNKGGYVICFKGKKQYVI